MIKAKRTLQPLMASPVSRGLSFAKVGGNVRALFFSQSFNEKVKRVEDFKKDCQAHSGTVTMDDDGTLHCLNRTD